jgi:hypothetical protein
MKKNKEKIMEEGRKKTCSSPVFRSVLSKGVQDSREKIE